MVVDYLNRLESLDYNSLQRQDREDIIMTLGYLQKRERDPELSKEITNQILKLSPPQAPKQPNYVINYKGNQQ